MVSANQIMTDAEAMRIYHQRASRYDVWHPGIEVTPPIFGSDIPEFVAWVNWNGFRPGHDAFDYAAYLAQENGKIKCIIGLPPKTPIRAIADGVVFTASEGLEHFEKYALSHVRVSHGHKLASYLHVIPTVKKGDEVSQGDQIGYHYKDRGKKIGRLVHCHFRLRNKIGFESPSVDPTLMFPDLQRYIADKQGELEFIISGLDEQPDIEVAHFKELRM